MVTAASRLLEEVEALSHADRTRHLALLTRREAGSPGLATLLADLSARGPWEARLALTMADVAGDLDHLRTCLDPADPALLTAALAPAVRHGLGADELIALLPDLPAAAARPLVRALRQRGAGGLADALLGPVRERYGDRVAAAVLVSCSPTVVDAELSDLAWAVGSWATLGRRHPRSVLDHVDRELVATPPSTWAAVVAATGPGLAEAALVEPARVLAVLETASEAGGAGIDLSRSGPIGGVLGALARHDPARVARLLVGAAAALHGRIGRLPGRRLWRALAVLGDDDLRGLLDDDHAVRRRLLRAVAPARRPALLKIPVDALAPALAHDVPVLDLLPWWARHEQARLLLASRTVLQLPRRVLEVTARLPWPDAEPVLRRAAHGPRAEDRAEAYPLLVHAAALTRDPVVVEELLGSLDRLAREQEPVRAEALSALVALRPEVLTDTAAADLAALLTSAVRAADVSWSTQAAASAWATAMVAAGVRADRGGWVEAGTTALRSAAEHLEHLSPGPLTHLPADAVPRLLQALEPRLDRDARRDRHDVLLDLVGALGPRAWDHEDLQRRLRAATRASDRSTAERAVDLWLAPPRDRDDRVARLLRRDRSTFGLDAVATAVATRRTDLLGLVLGRRLRGRFASRGVRLVPRIGRHSGRWTPTQAARYADDLRAIVGDDGAAAWERAAALDELARVPGTTDDLRRTLDDPLPQLADTALRAIAWTDDPAVVLSDLLARTDDDRAHVAVVAAGRVARRVPPGDLVEPLRQALGSGRVTARKEVCRLLVELRVHSGADLVVAVVRDDTEHRDVRRAAALALRGLLDDPGVLAVLTEAAHTHGVGPALTEVRPAELPPRDRGAWSRLVLAVAGHDDPDDPGAADRATVQLQAWVPWDDSGAVAAYAVEVATDLTARQLAWRAAVGVVVAAVRHRGAVATVLEDSITRLVALHGRQDREDGLDAGVERDLPARRRVEAVVSLLAVLVPQEPALTEPAAAVASLLATEPLLLDLAATAAEAAVPWRGDPDVRLARLRSWAALGAAAVGTGLPDEWHDQSPPTLPDEVVVADVAALRADGDAGSALVALRLLDSVARRERWTSPLRAELRALRRHDDPAVRLAAARMSTAAE